MTCPRLQRLALVAGLILALGASLRATEDHDNATPTAWLWYHGQSVASLSSVVASGYRIVDLEVEQTAPLRFTAALVHNSASYAKTWWWYVDVDLNTVGNLLTQNTARLIDIEPYESSTGSIRYAVLMVRNTGADAKAWWYVSSTDFNDVTNAVSANNARVVDLEQQTLFGNTWYTAIMISNTGADASGWWWWLGASQSFLSNEIATKNLRLIDLERQPNGTYNAVLVPAGGMHWWWFIGQSEAGLSQHIAQTGSRIQSIQPVDFGGTKFFYAVLHNNSNELTTRIGDILRNGSDGDSGLYLKEVNGGVRASLQQDFVFEPASTIKTLMHAHAMRQIEGGSASLSENLTVWTGISGNSCPIYTGPISEGMSTVLELMMMNSDNNRTMAVRDRFGGNGAFNTTAASLGMANTQIVHTLGCGGPPPNSLTLSDGGRLHEAIANGYLGGSRQDFYDHMLTSVPGYGNGRLGVIIDEEAAALGLSDFVKADFESHMAMAYKGGSYGYGNPLDFYWSVLAWSRIPFLEGGQLTTREYVSGIFIHDASTDVGIGATMDEAAAELLRDEIRAALQTWQAAGNGWSDLGGGVAGNQPMVLTGLGSLAGGTQAITTLTGAEPNSVASFVLGVTYLGAPFKGGVWGPFPTVLVPGIPTGPSGTIALPTIWPTGLPSFSLVYVQWWMADGAAPLGFAGSNTIRGVTP